MLDQLISFFISNAYADFQTGVPSQQGGGISFILMFVVLLGFIYFAVWRPQSKRAKEQQHMLSSLAKGDEVVTAGGLLGRITKISDAYVTLFVTDNVEIVMQKSSVINVLPKGTLKTIE